MHVSVSQLRVLQSCRRRYSYEYKHRIRPISRPEPLDFGSLLHVGLAAVLRSQRAEMGLIDCLTIGVNAMRAEFLSLPDGGELTPYHLVLAEEMLAGHTYRYDRDEYQILAVEERFSLPVIDPLNEILEPVDLVGGIDAIVRDSAGRVWVLEHKSTTLPLDVSSPYWERVRIDDQCSVYIDACERLGYQCEGVIYNVLRRPRLTPALATPEENRKFTMRKSVARDGTERPAGSLYAGQRETDETLTEFRERVRGAIAEDPTGHFQRAETQRFAEELEDARRDIASLAAECQRPADVHWPKNTASCLGYGRRCDYWPICTRTSSPDDRSLYQPKPE